MTARGWRARPFLAKVHRYVGLGMALFLIVSGLTGALLAFYHELDHALNPGLFRVQERRVSVLRPNALVASVQTAYPGTHVIFLARHRVDGKTDALRVDRVHLMPFLYRLHHSLHLPERWGAWLMGLMALAWMFDCLVGFYLTLPSQRVGLTASPKAPTVGIVNLTYRSPKKLGCQTAGNPTYTTGKSWWQRWKPAWRIKRGVGASRLNFDLHRAGGLWLWGMLFMLAMSGVYSIWLRKYSGPW